jgi:hypothetical protein
MKQYRLKKDLPFAKAGAEITVGGRRNWVCIYVTVGKGTFVEQKVPITHGMGCGWGNGQPIPVDSLGGEFKVFVEKS